MVMGASSQAPIMSAHALPTPQPIPRLRPLRTRSDEALRAMSARGDAAAFAELYQRHHAALYRYCRSILHHDEDARDALHTTMANAWASLQRADREVPLRPWLFRIAHNEAITILRRRRAHDELDDVHADTGRSLEEVVEERQRLDALRADLAELPERQRSALLLRELCGLAHAEIAAVLAVTPAVAKQSIFEARTALHEAEAGRRMTCAEVRSTLSDGDGRVRRGRRIKGHLRACADCAAFQEALRARPAQLAALFPPLPAVAGVGLLARLLSSVGASGGATSAAPGVGAASLPVAGAGGAAATGLAAKVVSASLVALTAGGLATADRFAGDSAPRPAGVTTRAPAGADVGAPAGAGAGAATPDRGRTGDSGAIPSVARSPVDPAAGAQAAPSTAVSPADAAGSPTVPSALATGPADPAHTPKAHPMPGRHETKPVPDDARQPAGVPPERQARTTPNARAERPAAGRPERQAPTKPNPRAERPAPGRPERQAPTKPNPGAKRPASPPGLDRAPGARRAPAESQLRPQPPERAGLAAPEPAGASKAHVSKTPRETGNGQSHRPDRAVGAASAPAVPDVARAPSATGSRPLVAAPGVGARPVAGAAGPSANAQPARTSPGGPPATERDGA
jgi:RNA polymerase sigma factor (sigma-70 family)